MKLHRLVLTNYRGISHREISLPDRGVVVVSGANEIGKSSMIEALDLLLEAKDRSTKREVKQVKPTHADVGAEVTAEISTGPYRFVYRKRFHKRTETQLTVLAPHREQLTGDEAHECVRAMLDDTVDVGLWQAQRVLQASSTAAVDLSGSDALARALDVAAGEAVQLSGAEPLLIDRIDAEHRRYFTATGRPTGEWAAAANRLRLADEEVARCTAALAEVDDAVHEHARLTAALSRLADERTEAATALAAARLSADAVAKLTQNCKEAELVAAAAEAVSATTAAALAERRRLRVDVDERSRVIAELEIGMATAADELATATGVREAADDAAAQALVVADTCQRGVDAARLALERLTERDEADRLAGRVAAVDAAQRDLDRVNRNLADIALTDDSLRAIEAAAAAVERATGRAEQASARLEVAAAADVEVVVAGVPVRLEAGAVWSSSIGARTDVEVPGLVSVRVVPGAPAVDTCAELEAAHQVLAEALRTAEVLDIADARVVDARRRQLSTARDTLHATSDALTADESIQELRARLQVLRDRGHADGSCGPSDHAEARARLDAALAAQARTIAEGATLRRVAQAAADQLGQCAMQTAAVTEKLTAARAELAAVNQRLGSLRAIATDDGLAVKAQADEEQRSRAQALVDELRVELAASGAEGIAAALHQAVSCADALERRHVAQADALRDVSARLKVFGTDGRKGQLDAADAEREHAGAEYVQVHRRARAAALLRSTMARHRDTTRLRYVDPFRAEVERLGRLVFGESFEVEIDSDLRICSRTVAGHTVPYESLSGGAKEQLGIVARLAGAALVAREDAVPVVLDDALGFTDADRLAGMGRVFDAVGGDGQVIVLTCHPLRFAAIADAHHIELAV